MKTKKMVALFLIIAISVFTNFPLNSFAADPLVEQSAAGTISLAKPISETEPPEALLAEKSPQPYDMAAFFLESPLSGAEEKVEDTDLHTLSNDPFYGTSGSWGQSYDDLWWLKRVQADQAWGISRGLGTTVAVIDTGVDFYHEDLSANIWYNDPEQYGIPGYDDDGNGFVDDIRGWDFHNNDNDSRDDHGHGTHVAGIIGAVSDNALGISGVAPDSKIMSLKVLDASGRDWIENVVSAIRYAADKGAQVINMSLGVMKNLLSKVLQKSFESAVQYAVGKGSVVVAAAGNEGSNVNNVYPAAIKNVIAVGATEPVSDKKAYFSNFGTALDFVAPGVDILSLRAGNTSFGSASGSEKYARASGTSMSSPIVAGVVALLKSWNPLLTLPDIYQRLVNSASDLGARGFDKNYGYGLVNAYKALTLNAASVVSVSQITVSDTSTQGRKNVKAHASSIASLALELPAATDKAITGNIGPSGNWYPIEAIRAQVSEEHNFEDEEEQAPVVFRLKKNNRSSFRR